MASVGETRGGPEGIACPWCGHFIRDLWDGLMPMCDGDTTETCCGKCEKPVVLEAEYTAVIKGIRGKEEGSE